MFLRTRGWDNRSVAFYISFWVVLIVSVILHSGLAAAAANLLKNPDFFGAENQIPPPDWALYGNPTSEQSRIALINADKPEQRALHIVDGVSIPRGQQGEIGLQQTVPAEPGKRYRLSAVVKAVPNASSDGAYLQLRFLPSGKIFQVELTAWKPDAFEEIAVEGTAPDDTTHIRVYIWTGAPATPQILLRSVALVGFDTEKEQVWTAEQARRAYEARYGEIKPGQVVPKVGLYITAADIEQARRRVQTEPWARALQNSILAEVDFWARLPDSWYQQIIPPAGSIFAYGETGCPIDGSPWPRFGGNGVADFTRPLTLRCPNGELIRFNDPNSPYYDLGTGVVINGTRYYLRGVWNAFVTNQLAGIGGDAILHKLAYAYALTGAEQYANKALTIMDLLATLSPTTIGPRDFASSDTQIQGRLHWYTSIANRARMQMLNAYDLLYHTARMHEPSPSNPGLTIAENIEKNLLQDYLFDEFDPREGKLRTLHNHEADAVRAMLGVGLVLGNPDWIRWGIEAVYAFFDNTINRDGMYYETSPSYAEFTRGVFLDMAELVANYDPENYITAPKAEWFPRPETFPYGLNLYDHPHFRKFTFGYRERIDAGGHRPAYGNSPMPTGRATTGAVDLATWQAVQRFYLRTSNPEWKQQYGEWLAETMSGTSQNRYDIWALFHSEPLPTPGKRDAAQGATVSSEPEAKLGTQSDLLPAAALAILRSDNDRTSAAVIRGGTTLPHGHDDVLAVNLYQDGYHLTADIGYGISGSPVHLGWGTRSVAHNLVVVNEGLNRNGAYHQLGPGSDITAYWNGKLADIIEMDAAKHYQPEDQLTTYRRGFLQVETPTGPYYVDLFHVTGGQTHDYTFHARADQVTYDGLQVERNPKAWTLAGLSNPTASYNAPGRSWGERIAAGEYVKNLGIPGQEVRGRGWAPPPGNGYGFIYDLRSGRPERDTWQTVWPTDVGIKVRMTSLPDADTAASVEVHDGFGPDLLGRNRFRFVIERRQSEGNEPLSSQFVHLFEAYRLNPIVQSAERLPLQPAHPEAVALKLTLRDSTTRDYVLYGGPSSQRVADAAGELQWEGHTAIVRVQDETVQHISLLGARKLNAFGWTIESVPTWAGHLTAVSPVGAQVETDVALPPSDVLKGLPVLIDHPDYKRNAVYFIHDVQPLQNGAKIDFGDTTFDLARAQVELAHIGGVRLLSTSPLPTGHAYGVSTGYLDGREVVVEETGARLQVASVPKFSEIQLAQPLAQGDVRPGDRFSVRDIKAGDSFQIRNVVEMQRMDEGTWQVRITAPTRIQFPAAVKAVRVETGSHSVTVPAVEGSVRLDPVALGSGTFRMIVEE